MVHGLGFRVLGSIGGLWFMNHGFRVYGLGGRVQGLELGFKV